MTVRAQSTRALAALCQAILLIAALAAPGLARPAAAEEGVHLLALQLSDRDPAKMTTVLNVAANVSRHYSALGELVDIEIVAFGPGVHMFRPDTSPVRERLENFMQSMVNVRFVACGNTLDTMARAEGARPALLDGVDVVQTGVAHLLELSETGWTLVRP